MYPRTVSTPIDEASISLISRKIPVMVRCIITGWERGEGFVQLGLPCTLPGYPHPPMHVNPKYSFENAAPPNLSISDSKSTTGGRKIRKTYGVFKRGGDVLARGVSVQNN